MNFLLSLLAGIVGGLIWAATSFFYLNPTLLSIVATVISSGVFGVFVGYVTNIVASKFDNSADKKARKNSIKDVFEQNAVRGVSVEQFTSIILETNHKIGAVRLDVKDPVFSLEAHNLLRTCVRLVEQVEKNPKHYLATRSWFNTYLDQTINVIDTYVKMLNNTPEAISPDVRAKAIEELKNFEKHYANIIEDLVDDDSKKLLRDIDVLKAQLPKGN